MPRYVLVFLAAAVLCTAVLAQDVIPAHKGKHGDVDYGYSSYDSSIQRYRPVKCGKNLCLYHIHAWLQVDTYQRSNTTTAPFIIVYTGTVLDYTTNVTTGTFEVAGIATTQPVNPDDTRNILENFVFEFGPEGDDALTVTGNSQVHPATRTVTDSDMAITGGTGQFFGAYGDFADKPHMAGGDGPTEADITIYVPKNKL